jgi:hypothetical protein
VANTSQFVCLTTNTGEFAAAGIISSFHAISFGTVASALTEVQEILPVTIPVIKSLTVC